MKQIFKVFCIPYKRQGFRSGHDDGQTGKKAPVRFKKSARILTSSSSSIQGSMGIKAIIPRERKTSNAF